MTLRQHIDTWYAELYGKRNAAIVEQMVAPDCQIHGLPAALHGPKGFMLFLEVFAPAFERIAVTVEDSIEQGDKIAFRASVALTTKDGKHIEMDGGGIVRFRGAMMVEAWNTWDFLALLSAAGAVPADIFTSTLASLAGRS